MDWPRRAKGQGGRICFRSSFGLRADVPPLSQHLTVSPFPMAGRIFPGCGRRSDGDCELTMKPQSLSLNCQFSIFWSDFCGISSKYSIGNYDFLPDSSVYAFSPRARSLVSQSQVVSAAAVPKLFV